MVYSSPISRRSFLKASAVAAAGAVVAPHIQTSHAAGSLSIGFWKHTVPGANAVLTKLCNEWAKKEKVDLKVDYILKLGLAINSEAQLQAGHDIVSFANWFGGIPGIAEKLEPVDDIMLALIRQNGPVAPVFEYLGKQGGHWIAVPATAGSQLKVPCARIDVFQQHVGLDLTRMYPPHAPPDKMLSENWTWETFRVAAEKCYKAGYPFGLGT